MALDYGKMEFAVSFKPITAFPLDSRSYYESLAAAEAAAASAVEAGSDQGTVYFGQTFVVVENGVAQMLQVQPDGTLSEIGGKIEIDEKQFAIDEESGKLSLFGFADAVAGAQLVVEEVELEGEKVKQLKWVKPDTTTVDGLATAVEGLEAAQKTLSDKIDEIEEYLGDENTGFVKDINDAIDSINESIELKANADDVHTKDEVNDLISDVNDAIALKADADNVYTIKQADDAIAAAVAGADHLKRKIMGSVEEIEAYAAENADATQYIFMVSNGLQADDNRYYEYMVFEVEVEDAIERKVERVGNWAVDLSGYATTGALEALSQTVTDNKSAIEQSLNNEKVRAEAAEKALGERIDAIDFIDSDELNTALAPYAKTADVTTALEPYAKTEDVNKALDEKADAATTLAGYGITDAYTKVEADKAIADKVAAVTGGESAAAVKLLLEAEVSRSTGKDDEHDNAINTITEKLNGITPGAQVNVIDSVEETEFSIDAVKKLSLLAVPAAKITGLAEHEAIVALSNSIAQNAQNITTNANSITSLSESLNNYVLNTTYSSKMTEIDADLAALKDAITWKEV